MTDEIFEKIKSENLLDWGVFYWGIAGIPGSINRLSPSLAHDFLDAEVEKTPLDDPLFDIIIGIHMNDRDSQIEVCQQIAAICEAKGVDLNAALRKWRFFFLRELILQTHDSFDSLMGIYEFWSDWGWPEDAPAYVKGNWFDLFSQETSPEKPYHFIIQTHQQWLDHELEQLH